MSRFGVFLTCALVVSAAACREDGERTVAPAEASATPRAAPADGERPGAAAPAEASVKPGINDAWKSDDIDPLVDRLESEDREIYSNRIALAKIVDAKPGSVVADVGSGTGFMTTELARAVGTDGKVYAVDINAKMLEKVDARAKSEGITNIETVQTPDTGVELPTGSVDLMFICDTYHHFEYPKSVLGTIFEVIKPGGALIVVDFDRIEGETEEWILEHVRAGKDVFSSEITAAGFELVQEHEVPGLVQNYVLRFKKPGA
jgi:ubiquinone/menaquinone biosynthesis C-methylase UbiE